MANTDNRNQDEIGSDDEQICPQPERRRRIRMVNTVNRNQDEIGSDDEQICPERITRVINEDPTTKRLFSFLERRHDYHPLIRNEIDEIVQRCVSHVEKKIGMFEEKCLPILERKIPVPALIRNRRDELVELLTETGGVPGCRLTASAFEGKIHRAAIRLLNSKRKDDDGDYRGLDSNRDTETEVENILRIYPDVLNYYPRVFRCESLRSVAFVPKIAQLRIELCGNSNHDARGGLLLGLPVAGKIYSLSALQRLTAWTPPDVGDKKLFEDRSVAALKRLLEMGLLRKEDVEEQRLLSDLCCEHGGSSCSSYFAERRFRFLSSLDPAALTRTDGTGRRPLHHAACVSTIQSFRLVFETGIHYFPKITGIRLLFQKGDHGYTPFRAACKRHGREEVLKLIERTLADYPGDPYDAEQALLSAAADQRVDADCVYFILRREPDVLAKLISSGCPHVDSNSGDGDSGGGTDNRNDRTNNSVRRDNWMKAAGKR